MVMTQSSRSAFVYSSKKSPRIALYVIARMLLLANRTYGAHANRQLEINENQIKSWFRAIPWV